MESFKDNPPSVQQLIEEFEGQRDIEMSEKVVNRLSATMVDIPNQQFSGKEEGLGDAASARSSFSKNNRIMYEKISPSNRFWLRFYFVVGNIGVVLLIIAYTFYVMGLFDPILYLDAGEFTDTDLFQPLFETLPHSIVTLYNQKAYFTVVIAGIFSITLPFLKMIATAVAYITSINHRRRQLRLFFGSKPIDKSVIRKEDDGIIKYSREMLIVLKLISKFQMVDVVILLLNTVFLRCAFLWARPGKGLLFLIIYCLLSIAGAQMVNFCVEGEKDIFNSWYAIKYAIVPPEFSINSNSSMSNDESITKDDMPVANKNAWYTSEDFICLMAGLNILSCLSLMTNEKLLTVSFTMDERKIVAMDTTSMSYPEFIMNLHGMDYGRISITILFFLCIMFPIAFSLLFMASIFGYNYCKRNRTEPQNSVEIADCDDDEPKLEHDWDVKITGFMFKLCNILSEWSCGEVVSLGTMAAYVSMTTADRVRVTIPPKNTCSALLMMGAFGITSFLLVACFCIWNQKFKREFSRIRIYVKYLESPNPSHMARLLSANNFTEQCTKSTSISNICEAEPENEENEEKGLRWRFFVPYLEGIRMVLYSKWFSSVFFGIFTAVVVICTMSAYTYSYPPPHVDSTAVNEYLHNDFHDVFKLALKQIPQSIGLCDEKDSPPELPCMGIAPLIETKSSLYGGIIWASGLKTISLIKANYSLSEDKRLTFNFKVHINQIKALVRVAAIREGNLKNLLQSLVTTTDGGFDVELQISAQCVNRRPQLRDLRVDKTVMENFSLTGSVADLLKDVVDINEAAGNMVTTKVNEILRDNRQRIIWRGISFDITEMLNLIVANNWPTSFVCPVSES